VLRGTPDDPNPQESLENVVVDPTSGVPDFLINPTKNMRAIFSRERLLRRKGVEELLSAMTGGVLREAVHVPIEHTDRVFWQAVMRQNTVIPPLRRLNLEQYVRALMYGEAVQMGAAAGGTIGKPYVEYFSDPFIIGLEDENANLMYYILREMERGGQEHHYYAFNTGGIGADTNDEASGARYKKIPRDLTLMLQEALLRDAVIFEYDSILGSEFAVAVVNRNGDEIVDLRQEWLPQTIYGEAEYRDRVVELRRRRFYGKDAEDKAGILRYTKVSDAVLDILDIPAPSNEREISWLLSFYWHVDRAYGTLGEVATHRAEGMRPPPHLLRVLQNIYDASKVSLGLSAAATGALGALGIRA
jgi:ATP-dependent phosphoenolpyruvate carboxykinase